MTRLRYSNGTTSLAAAVENLPRAGTQKATILEALRRSGTFVEPGRTRDQLEMDTGLSGNAVRPRVQELIEAGLVEETERTRTTRSGSQAYVLVAVSNSGVGAGSASEVGRAAALRDLSTDSGVEATASTSPPPVPGEDVGGSARPLNPYEAEVWAE